MRSSADDLADLESFVLAQIQELRRLSADSRGISVIEKLFIGFDGLPPEKKRSRILQAIDAIDAFRRETVARVAAGPDAIKTPPGDTAILRCDTLVQFCRGVGPKRALLMKKLGIDTVEDALYHLPWRYEDRGNLKKISRLACGTFESISGEVVSAEVVQTRRKWVKVFELVIRDGTGVLVGSWYNQPFMQKVFKPGQSEGGSCFLLGSDRPLYLRVLLPLASSQEGQQTCSGENPSGEDCSEGRRLPGRLSSG